ncbi:hypothetical protein C8R46DRAFT_1167204 [Mycena filopes]|nr:hypothetical protein C8R46DRAFT_1167204 [Mycena filopes]
MPPNVPFTPDRRSRTPSPGPMLQPSSGPNPTFDPSPPKRRGGQPISIKLKRQRLSRQEAEDEQESWTAEQSAAEQSRVMQEKLAAAAAEKAAREAIAAAKAEQERTVRVQDALQALKNAGCKTTFQFFEEFFASTNPEISKRASRLVHDHGTELLDLLHSKQPQLVERWALKVSLPVIAAEGEALADLLRPDKTREFTSRLETWSLERMLAEATVAAPNLCELLMLMGMTSDVGREDNKLVLVTVLCMLAQSQNERANKFQEIMGTYFLACNTPRRQFDVLAHAGLTVSYTKAINDLKGLSAEGLARLRRMVQEKACMIVWDNLNIAFKVGEQRHDSKDTFENGTTATLIVLYGVLRGELELEILEPRTTRKPVLDFDPMDTLPTAEHILQTRKSVLWHVRSILLRRFPALAKKYKDQLGDVPVIRPIPLHQTEHGPTPAMKIDESSLDGTIDVIDTVVVRTLKFTAAGMRAHGVMFAGGDLLSLNLTDKAIAARREDTELLDAYGKYLKGMLGLFHVKLSGTRGTVNEHWGEPNSKFPGSLCQETPTISPTYELMLTLSLPAHILDGFRIYCGAESMDLWLKSDPTWHDIATVSETVVEKLCSASTVEELRQLPEAARDPQLENTILCNHDMLLLLLFTTSIKAGDVGMVVNILAHWMVMFRGTGSMPKYADALFELVNNLKRWPAALRCVGFILYLLLLIGKIMAFKEIDLLQEHQNFWAKVIYNARGSNRSWDWLSMITVVIFNLRDVMRNVQAQFKIPHHGISHTSPNAAEDIARLQGWLESNKLQSYVKERPGKDSILRVRDLMVAGAAYANTPGAFKNFRRETRKVWYKKTNPTDIGSDSDESDEEIQPGEKELDTVEPDDLMHDDEDFTHMADQLLDMAQEVVGI